MADTFTLRPSQREAIPTCRSRAASELERCLNTTANEPWTKAFLRMYYRGDPAVDCYDIRDNACTDDSSRHPAPSDSAVMNARYEYARHAIILIGMFFNAWFDAIVAQMGDTTAMIKPIIDKVDPPHKTNVFLAIVTQLISFGLMFVPGGSEIAQVSAFHIISCSSRHLMAGPTLTVILF